ncbi:alpha/beta fold hydrolase [Saliphagus sp. GCM10025317]
MVNATPDTGKKRGTVTSADGTTIAFERTGSGPPLGLVRGGACDHRFWELSGVRSAFADHYTVYAMDCRGVGESGDADEYALEREFKDVAAVVEAIDEPVTLLGHSSRALLWLEAALRTDDLLKLVLYEPPIVFGDHELYSDEVLVEMERLLKNGENEQMLALFLREIAQSTPEEIDAQRSAPDWQDLVDAGHVWPRSLSAVGEYEFRRGPVRQRDDADVAVIRQREPSTHERCDAPGQPRAPEQPDRYLRWVRTRSDAHRARSLHRRDACIHP